MTELDKMADEGAAEVWSNYDQSPVAGISVLKELLLKAYKAGMAEQERRERADDRTIQEGP